MKIWTQTRHIGVEDYRTTWQELGHELVIKSHSHHSHVFGWQRSDEDYDINRLHDATYCREWCIGHEDALRSYDAFLSFYPPLLALLWRALGKPIVMVCPVRYEFPYTNNQAWASVNDQLREMIDDGQLRVVANSLYDKAYTQFYLDRPVEYIPSWCGNYQNANFDGQCAGWIIDSRIPFPEMAQTVRKEHALPAGHAWSAMNPYSGFVMVPYNVSQMSFYERYAANMPHLLPTQELLLSWYNGRLERKQHWALQEVDWVGRGDYALKYFDLATHLPLSDWYNLEEYPELQYFESVPDLYRTVRDTDPKPIAERMKATNIARKERILAKWDAVLSIL